MSNDDKPADSDTDPVTPEGDSVSPSPSESNEPVDEWAQGFEYRSITGRPQPTIITEAETDTGPDNQQEQTQAKDQKP